ncbi:Ig-like domain-containing protein [Aeoliella mucimassa]|uniref:Uncharacterized protein n=1 Tax=Aeoliella mucimassa TaxID=2527972 RepID=A0A518AJD7_9BACT|nr:Ig-like domain-containing protein [Aeoliella mucimassa]QDU54830.1 hypothetical protein Pan181_10130 [Aeoliella mucimassa]
MFSLVPSEVIVNGGGTLQVQITGVEPDADYAVQVAAESAAGPFSVGNYQLTVSFSATSANLQSMASGTVGDSVEQTEQTLYVGRPQLFHFVLETGESTTTTPTAILATIEDDQGQAVLSVAALTGQTRSESAVLLAPGTYTARFRPISLATTDLPAISYNLLGTGLSDPFVGDPSDPTGNPFQCPDNPDLFCYPGVPEPKSNLYMWDSAIESLTNAPPNLSLNELADLLMGNWWSWYWPQASCNEPPLTMNDTFHALPTTSAVPQHLVSTRSVLENDVPAPGEAVVALVDTNVQHGTLTFNLDGTFDYAPEQGYVGTDQFTYTAYNFQSTSAPATVTLVVQLPGDYDNSGLVDENDYSLWKSEFGTTNLFADGNGDGIVNLADYTVWRDNLGASMPTPPALEALSLDATPVAPPVLVRRPGSHFL